VSYRERQRLADIQAAIDAIRSHLQRGDLSDGLVFDAVRIRLLEIGEAVKALPAELLDTQPGIPWRQIARTRDHLAHRYFDTAHAILQATVDDDLPELERAVHALGTALPDEDKPDDDAHNRGRAQRRSAKRRAASESAARLILWRASGPGRAVHTVAGTAAPTAHHASSREPGTMPSRPTAARPLDAPRCPRDRHAADSPDVPSQFPDVWEE
jgi:uncharacterized protein with HEPN domain